MVVICSNYSLPWQTGGSEIVIKQISESLKKNGIDVTILSKNAPEKNITLPSGVHAEFCGSGPDVFLKKLEGLAPTHVLVYSDYFVFWTSLLAKADKVIFKIVLIPVGLNASIENGNLLYLLKKHKERIEVVTHSENYQDYKTCNSLGIKIKDVIPNGVDLEEFSENSLDFRKKYDIWEEHILLCVANFFPGKGQEFLPQILERVNKSINDFTMIFICSTVKFHFDQMLAKSLEKNLVSKNLKYRILRDIPREDVIAAFKEADIFVFPSQKEVSPLVLLEAQAAETPWISLRVGNAPDLVGGYIVSENTSYTNDVVEKFSDEIINLLKNPKERESLSLAGRKQIEEKYNWDTIGNQYYNLFK